jgi:hypothetical protein
MEESMGTVLLLPSTVEPVAGGFFWFLYAGYVNILTKLSEDH